MFSIFSSKPFFQILFFASVLFFVTTALVLAGGDGGGGGNGGGSGPWKENTVANSYDRIRYDNATGEWVIDSRQPGDNGSGNGGGGIYCPYPPDLIVRSVTFVPANGLSQSNTGGSELATETTSTNNETSSLIYKWLQKITPAALAQFLDGEDGGGSYNAVSTSEVVPGVSYTPIVTVRNVGGLPTNTNSMSGGGAGEDLGFDMKNIFSPQVVFAQDGFAGGYEEGGGWGGGDGGGWGGGDGRGGDNGGNYTQTGQIGNLQQGTFYNAATGRNHAVVSTYAAAQAQGRWTVRNTGYNTQTVYSVRNANTGTVRGYISVARTNQQNGDNFGDDGGGWPGPGGGGSCSALVIPTFVDELPFGENGGFPVRLQIDMGENGNIDVSEYVNNQGPLVPGESIEISFPPVTFTAGRHEVAAYADIPNAEDPGRGCSNVVDGGPDTGCIIETPQANNELTVTVTALEPNIELGSFLQGMTSLLGAYDITYSSIRDYTNETNEVGLVWQGDEINFGLCTGSGISTDGNLLNDFSGQRDGYTWGVGNYYDVNVVEPPPGVAHIYTITCDTTAGGTVSDTHIINNGADVSDVLTLATYVSNRSVRAGDTISRQPFSIENQSDQDLDDVTYTIRIDGQLVRNNASTLDLVADRSQNVVSDVTWRAPDVTAVERVDLEVCADHPNITRESCSLATITINPNAQGCWLSSPDPNPAQCSSDCAAAGGVSTPSPGGLVYANEQCYCDGIPANLCSAEVTLADPIITATPAVVRQGGEFTLAWDPNGNPDCTLSSNAPAGANGATAGDVMVTANRQSTYTISCANGAEASVTIQLIPNLFET